MSENFETVHLMLVKVTSPYLTIYVTGHSNDKSPFFVELCLKIFKTHLNNSSYFEFR